MTRACTATIFSEINGPASASTTPAAFQTTDSVEGSFVLLLQTDCGLARKKGGDAIQKTSSKSGAILDEEGAKKALVTSMNTVQARARQKYFFTEPATLTDYYIGTERMDANRAILEQVFQAIIDKLITDTLPGVTAGQNTELADRRHDYLDTNLEQGGAQSGAIDDRNASATMLKRLTQRRMTIQFAVGAERPWHDKASAGNRKEFHLSPGGPSTE